MAEYKHLGKQGDFWFRGKVLAVCSVMFFSLFFEEKFLMPVMHAWAEFCGFCRLLDEFFRICYEDLWRMNGWRQNKAVFKVKCMHLFDI